MYLLVALVLFRVLLPSLPLVQSACRLIVMAPGAIVGPLLSVVGQGVLLFYWSAGATHIGSSGMLEFNAHGFASLTYTSSIKGMVVFHTVGGLWTGSIVAHIGEPEQPSHLSPTPRSPRPSCHPASPGKLIAANALGHAYWRAAEQKLDRGKPLLRYWLLCPLLHIGSVALGATASLLSPLLLPLQLAGLRTFDHFSEAGHALPPAPASPLPPCSSRLSTRRPLPYARYVAVAVFGANLSEANRWAGSLVQEHLPMVRRMQHHCAMFTLIAKLCVAATCACVAALVLAVDPQFKHGANLSTHQSRAPTFH